MPKLTKFNVCEKFGVADLSSFHLTLQRIKKSQHWFPDRNVYINFLLKIGEVFRPWSNQHVPLKIVIHSLSLSFKEWGCTPLAEVMDTSGWPLMTQTIYSSGLQSGW